MLAIIRCVATQARPVFGRRVLAARARGGLDAAAGAGRQALRADRRRERGRRLRAAASAELPRGQAALGVDDEDVVHWDWASRCMGVCPLMPM